MLRKGFSLAIIGTVCLCGLTASGAVINTTPDQFTLLAGGSLGTGSGVSIQGLSGAVGNVSLGQHTALSDSIYTTGTFSIDQHVTIDGRIVSTGNVSIGHHSSTGSIDSFGNSFLDQKTTICGNVTAGQNANISKFAAVSGDVNYGGSFWADRKAEITGQTGKDLSGLTSWSPSMRTEPQTWATGTQNLYFANNSTETLTPGSYGYLNVNNNSVIYLTAGTYNFSSLWLGENVRLVADPSAGSVIVTIANGLSTNNNVSLEGGDKGQFSFFTNGDVYLGNNNLTNANIISFGDSLTVDQNSQLAGTFYSAGNIWLAENVAVGAGQYGPGVPEPASIALLGMGILTLVKGRKMRRSR